MQYIASEDVNGYLNVTVSLSPQERQAIESKGCEVELFDSDHPDETFLGISFGRRKNYVVTRENGSKIVIQAYGDLHAFTVAASDCGGKFALCQKSE